MLTSEQLSLINEVLDLYSKDSALDLESLTHSQAPWINARKGYAPGDRCTKIIPKRDIKDYFKKFIQ